MIHLRDHSRVGLAEDVNELSWGEELNKIELTSALYAVFFFSFEVSVCGFDKCQRHSSSQIRSFSA